jgi:alkylated DNA repair dioxygenase AlkB
MARVRRLRVYLQVLGAWRPDDGLHAAVRECFTYDPGEDRATGYLFGDGHDWPAPLAEFGPALLEDLAALLDVKFPIVAFQAYDDGSGCGWHTDSPFDVQAILSLGVTRTFGVRPVSGPPQWIRVSHGDLVFMPSGFQDEWEHCVPLEAVEGERVSLVFRTPLKG